MSVAVHAMSAAVYAMSVDPVNVHGIYRFRVNYEQIFAFHVGMCVHLVWEFK